MRRFAFRVILHILLIVLFSIGSYLLFQKQLWFSTTISLILLITTAIHHYIMKIKQIDLFSRLTYDLRYNEIIKNLKERSNTINIRKSVEEIIENIIKK